MTSRPVAILVLLLSACTLVGCPGSSPPPEPTSESKPEAEPERPAGVAGYYIHDDPAFYGETDIGRVPPGQVMYLGIEDGRWMMRNMLSAYGGTWVAHANGATLSTNEGPAGKLDGKEKLIAKRTAFGVTLTAVGEEGRPLHFKYLGPSAPYGFGYDEFLGTKE